MEPILPEPTAPNAAPQNQESGGVTSGFETSPNVAPEKTRESTPTPVATPPVAQPLAQPVLQAPPAAPIAASAQSAQADDPVIADDVDVIEKEWVDKAKRIVNATKEDPYEQEKEVSKLQADYLMKRYNKQVKLSE